jgi:hypothetical protein|mmetsp:Transcript_111353/g.175468  ORF Transcript_111353/g.175468 Transcript_111353/m.175468 type:complete len:782 (-) Transcript_111353:192-2537(-)
MSSASELKKLFVDRVTLVPGSSCWLQVKLSGRGLGDEHMTELGRFLDQLLPDVDPNSSEEAVWANVELAENVIGSAGLISVLDALDRHRVSCKCIKLYKNKIGDEGGVRLAQQVSRQQSAVEEIHLSHNMFSARALVALCMALAKHEGYPMVGRSRLYIPCWVRMEYNHIARPNEVLDMLRQNGPVSICTADNREDCGPWRCVCANRTKNSVPKVHLFTIAVQSRNRVTPHDDAELREEIQRWGGDCKPLAPSVRKPAPTIPVGQRGAATPKPVAGTSCTTPTASMANAPPRVSPWDTNGLVNPVLRRSITAPATVGDEKHVPTTVEDLSSRSAKLEESRSVEEISAGNNSTGAPPSVANEDAGSGCGFSDKDDLPPKEAATEQSSVKSFEPPQRKAPAASHDSGNKPEAQSAKASAPPSAKNSQLQVGTQSSGNSTRKDPISGTSPTSSTGTGVGTGDNTSAHRKSLVLDGGGRRRILPKQLVEADNSGPFVCPLCTFVIAKPVITSCSHLFCEACFRHWVTDQVSKQKKSSDPGAPVPLVPCPQTKCSEKLRKQDIMLLDKADSTKVGAVALLQRLRNNLRVRCVHHCEHFKFPFGQDADMVCKQAGLKCEWIGDISAYDDHVKRCPIEIKVLDKLGARDNGSHSGVTPPPPPGAPTRSSPKGSTHSDAKAKASLAQKPSPEAKINGSSNGVEVPVRPENGMADSGEVRIAQYDYVPREMDKAQISLQKHDFVRVFEITDSGWAAGVRLSRDTMTEVGEAGWFPEGYLFPPTGAGQKKE